MGVETPARGACGAVRVPGWGGVNGPDGWVACPDGLPGWDIVDRLRRRANVVVVPGRGFGRRGEGFFRISAFNSRENVQEVVHRLKTFAAVRT